LAKLLKFIKIIKQRHARQGQPSVFLINFRQQLELPSNRHHSALAVKISPHIKEKCHNITGTHTRVTSDEHIKFLLPPTHAAAAAAARTTGCIIKLNM
jgi:hypothetical protein